MHLTDEQIARVTYEANRALQLALGEEQSPPWDVAAAHLTQSHIKGVRFRRDNPDAPASAQHDAWRESKTRDGWVPGPEKNEELKLHPDLVPFYELPASSQAKGRMFCAIVENLAPAD
jgi:hypothetical protein